MRIMVNNTRKVGCIGGYTPQFLYTKDKLFFETLDLFFVSIYNKYVTYFFKEVEEMAKVETSIEELEAKQFVKMTKTPIAKLIIGLGIPTTLSMMVTSLYNLADTYFVSMIGNDDVTAAVSNLLALMSIIQAIGFTFGMGSGAIISTLLGKRDREGANKVGSSAFASACLCGLFVLIFGFIFLTPLMRLFGSRSTDVLKYSKEYATYILFAAPFMCMSFVLNNILRAEGKPTLSMVGLVVGALVNVVLDPLLIFALKLGVAGAALATAISQFTSFCILLSMFLSGKTIIRLRLKAVSRTASVYKNIIITGFPSFCRQILASLCTVFLNQAAFKYGQLAYGEGGGAATQAALGVVQKFFMLAFSLSLGIGQGYQPVLGYNYSAERYDRVRAAYRFTLTFAVCMMVLFAVVCFIFAENLMQMFSLSSTAAEIGTLTLRFQCMCMPLLPFNFMVSITYQSVGNKGIATLLSISRQGLFYIPFVLLLPVLMGLKGVQCCQAVSDLFAFVFALPFTVLFFKQLKKAEQKKIEREQA